MLLAIALMRHDAEKLKYFSFSASLKKRMVGDVGKKYLPCMVHGKWQFTVAKMMYQSNRFTSNLFFFECSQIGTSFVFIGESKLHAAI